MSISSVNLGRGPEHDALAAFLGEWRAEGTAYADGGEGVPWTGEHIARWHGGEYFVVQEERARVGGEVVDTLSVLGVYPETSAYLARSFETGGAQRNYVITRQGPTWRFWADEARASITFSDDHRKQTIVWECQRDGEWMPLCERVAVRVD